MQVVAWNPLKSMESSYCPRTIAGMLQQWGAASASQKMADEKGRKFTHKRFVDMDEECEKDRGVEQFESLKSISQSLKV